MGYRGEASKFSPRVQSRYRFTFTVRVFLIV